MTNEQLRKNEKVLKKEKVLRNEQDSLFDLIYWVDSNLNKWSCNIYSKEEAIEASKSLIECYYCLNCRNLSNCRKKENCNGLI